MEKSYDNIRDDHSTKCGVCLETAIEAINDFNQGKTVKEIRQIIDNKYKEGCPCTNTDS